MLRCAAALFMLVMSAPIGAWAHVRVFPDVDLFVPKGMIVYAVEPKPNWQFNLQRTRGVVTMITWSGGRLNPYEFDEFAFLAATPRATGSVTWDAWQYYEDGSIVKWIGKPGAETPHSVTAITAGHCKK